MSLCNPDTASITFKEKNIERFLCLVVSIAFISGCSSSASIGVDINFGSQSDITYNASASQGKGSGSGESVSHTNTHIKAGGTVSVQSGGDTTLRGATIVADAVKADVGGNLTIESLQDTNGILNPLDRAGQLAMQNAELVNKTDANPAGEKPTAICLMHNIPANNNNISELMVAAYEKSLAPTLGYTNQDQVYADALTARGEQTTTSLGHSRGTIVQINAFNLLADQGFSNPNLSARGVGGAVTAQEFTDAGAKVIVDPIKVEQNITFNYFSKDPVAVAAGGNPGVLSLSEFWQVVKTPNSTHSCYGTGAAGCGQVEILIPNAPAGAVQDNSGLIRFRGGQQIDAQGNPVDVNK